MKDEKFSLQMLRELDEMFNESHNVEEKIYYFDSDNNATDKEHATRGVILKIDRDTGQRISEDRFDIVKKKM